MAQAHKTKAKKSAWVCWGIALNAARKKPRARQEGGTARDSPRPGPFLFSEKTNGWKTTRLSTSRRSARSPERVRLDVAMIAHRLEALQCNLENAPSPCNGRAIAKVVGDFVTDLRDAIAPLR